MRLPLFLDIALGHLRRRKRQTVVSILGVALGVGFFVGINALMRGFQQYFITQIIDVAPHIVIRDEFRTPSPQPAFLAFPRAAVTVSGVKPKDEPRGIRNARAKLAELEALPGVAAAPTLQGQVILRYGTRDVPVSLYGIEPERERRVTNIERDLAAGRLEDLRSTANALIVGVGVAEKLGGALGDTISVVSPRGVTLSMKIVGLIRTGISSIDNGQAYALLKTVQVLQNRSNVVNQIRIRLDDVAQAEPLARRIEARMRYRTESWEETNRNVLSLFVIQNSIMYSVVGAILLVAAFGIYNIISTVVYEKTRDIAILKSLGFGARHSGHLPGRGRDRGASGRARRSTRGPGADRASGPGPLRQQRSRDRRQERLHPRARDLALRGGCRLRTPRLGDGGPDPRPARRPPQPGRHHPRGGVSGTTAPVVEARAVSRTLPGPPPVTIIQDASLAVAAGEFVAVTGPSGSGKSSLLYLLGLLDRPSSGTVLVDGRDTGRLGRSELDRLRLARVGFVFQFHFLLPEFTTLDNVLIPMRKLGRLDAPAMRARAQALLERLNLAEAARKYPEQLSGGMRQRVAIARALANDPALLLADEPTGNLDTANARIVFDIFERLTTEEGRTVIVVTHDPDLAARTRRRVQLVDGRIVSDG